MTQETTTLLQRPKAFKPPVYKRYSSLLYYSYLVFLLFSGLANLIISVFLTVFIFQTLNYSDTTNLILNGVLFVLVLMIYLGAFFVLLWVFIIIRRGYFRVLGYSWYYELYPSSKRPKNEEEVESPKLLEPQRTSTREAQKIKNLETQIKELEAKIKELSKK